MDTKNDTTTPERDEQPADSALSASPGSETAEAVVKVCHKAAVEKVTPAIHHGLHFLLSEGPENLGGIVFRDDSYNLDKLKVLAEKVNEILSENTQLSKLAENEER